jgi:hypothetical protein
MKLIDILKTFFKGSKVDPAVEAIRDAFSAASDACDTPFCVIEAYTTRANHRYAILEAKYALSKASYDDRHAAEAYDNAVAAYTDPADFAPYTEAYLDAHTTVCRHSLCRASFTRASSETPALASMLANVCRNGGLKAYQVWELAFIGLPISEFHHAPSR